MTEQSVRTFIGVAQPVAFQRNFRFELFTTQIAQVMPFCVVSVHVSLQVTPAAACIVAHATDVGLQTCTHGHTYTNLKKNKKKKQKLTSSSAKKVWQQLDVNKKILFWS